ncbi:AsmA family protein [Alcaligenaceae bacterium]|nr:AsmA family protein [Alcaligenaceae bacterium]
MKFWLKRVLIGIVALMIVALVGIAIFLLTFDPNAYKSKLEEIVYNRFHRTLTIKGDIQLSLFPRIGLAVEDVSLSDREGEDTFASIDSARFAVAIWPLLSNRLVVDHVAVSGFKAWVRRNEHGKFNFDDLLGRAPAAVSLAAPGTLVGAAGHKNSQVPAGVAAQPQPGITTADVAQSPSVGAARDDAAAQDQSGTFDLSNLLGRLLPFSTASAQDGVEQTDFQIDIAGLEVKNGEIHFYDVASGTVGRIEKLEANTGRVTFNQAFDVALKGHLVGQYPAADAALAGQALVRFDPAEQTYSAQKLNLQVQGKLADLDAKSATLRGNLAYEAFSRMLNVSNFELSVQGEVGGASPITGLDTTLVAPKLKIDRSRAELKVEKLAYRAKGKQKDQTFDIALDAPSLAVSPEKASGEPVQATFKLVDPKGVLGVSMAMNGLGGDASKLTLKELKVDATDKKGDRVVRLKMTSPASWQVFRKLGGLSAMRGDIRIEDKALPGGNFEFPFIGSLQADLFKDRLDTEINAVLSGSKLNFTLSATQLKDPKVNFAFVADTLDFNTLFPSAALVEVEKPSQEASASEKPAAKPAPKPAQAKPAQTKPAAPPEKFDFGFLDAVDVYGTFAIDQLQVKALHASSFKTTLQAAEGKLQLSDIHAKLYDGVLSGMVTATSKNNIGLNLELKDVDVGAFLHDYLGEDRLVGHGTVNLDLTSKGATTAALTAGLTGSTSITMRDGAVRGVDLAKTLNEVNEVVRNVFSGQLPQVVSQVDMSRQTAFSLLDARVDFSLGQGKISKLDVQAPPLRITQGTPSTLDLVNSQLDVLVNVRVTDSGSDEGKRLADLKGVTVPVRISGKFSKPSYQVQWQDIRSKVVKQAVKEGLIDMLSNQKAKAGAAEAEDGPAASGKQTDTIKSIGDALKGLLGQ